jgi:predicted metal-binding membrane protein
VLLRAGKGVRSGAGEPRGDGVDQAATAAAVLPPAAARQRTVILVALLGLAAVGWAVFLGQADDRTAMDEGMGPDLTMDGSWPLFLVTWVAMMVAMMFPAAAPMVVMYGRMRRGDPPSVALFTGSYIALWIVFGVAAFLLSAAVEWGASHSDWVGTHWGRVGGILLVIAGLYQLTPLKDVCLRHCRSPLVFVLTHWRDGRRGAMRMGLVHGLYCVGCCWPLFLILIPLGVMNVAAMVAIALLVFAEKTLPHGRGVGTLASVALVAAGVAVAAEPSLLPTVNSM